jgi:hypothetical protein
MKAIEILQSYKNETKACRDEKVKLEHMEVGDLVLLRCPRTKALGKLEPKWTGPFMVVDRTRPASFRLANSEGRVLEHSWNANNLYHFYI